MYEAGRIFLAGERPALFFPLLVNNIVHQQGSVNPFIHQAAGGAVDYKDATNRLLERITTADLARELGVSQNAIARARLDPATRDFRPPPSGWRAAVSRLAGEQASRLLALKEALDSDVDAA